MPNQEKRGLCLRSAVHALAKCRPALKALAPFSWRKCHAACLHTARILTCETITCDYPCENRQETSRKSNMQQLQSNNNNPTNTKAGSSSAASAAPDADDAAQNWPGCFRHVARCRRLNKEEVVLILSDPLKFGLVRTEVLPAEGISSGTVYLCSKVRSSLCKYKALFSACRGGRKGAQAVSARPRATREFRGPVNKTNLLTHSLRSQTLLRSTRTFVRAGIVCDCFVTLYLQSSSSSS